MGIFEPEGTIDRNGLKNNHDEYVFFCTKGKVRLCKITQKAMPPRDGHGDPSLYYPIRCKHYNVVSVDEMLRIAENSADAAKHAERIKYLRAMSAYGENAKPNSSPTAKDLLYSRWSEDCKSNKAKIIIKTPMFKCQKYEVYSLPIRSEYDIGPSSESRNSKIKLRLNKPMLHRLHIETKQGMFQHISIFVCPGDTYELTKDGKVILQTAPCKSTNNKKLTHNLEIKPFDNSTKNENYYVTQPFDEIANIPQRCDYCIYYDKWNTVNEYIVTKYEKTEEAKNRWEPITHSVCTKHTEIVNAYCVCEHFTYNGLGIAGTLSYLIDYRNEKNRSAEEKRDNKYEKARAKALAEISEAVGISIDYLMYETLLNGAFGEANEKCSICGETLSRYNFVVTEKARASRSADMAAAAFLNVRVWRDAQAYQDSTFKCKVHLCCNILSGEGCGHWKVTEVNKL